jgi:hypothetical protein
MKYRVKHTFEAVTFDELVQHGIAQGGNVVNGMPWSFDWAGFPVTHENDNCYLISPGNGRTVRFERGTDMLVAAAGDADVMERETFDIAMEPAP